MSFVNANLPIQQFISYYGNGKRSFGVIPYVLAVSAANTTVNLDPNSFLFSGGKLRQVKLTYYPITCDQEGDCDSTLCDAGTIVQPAQIMFSIDRCIASQRYALNKDDIRYLDTNWTFSDNAKQIIWSKLSGIRKTIAEEWELLLYTMAGVHPDGNPEKRISVTNPTNGVVNAQGKFDIEREYTDAGFMTPYILGGQEVYNWINMVSISGLNASGQRIDQISTANTWYDDSMGDRLLDDAANGGHILSIDPQVFKYVWYSENAGIFRTDMASIDDLDLLYSRGTGDGFIEGTFIDSVTGLVFDIDMRYDSCNKVWAWQLKHHYNFFLMPDVACNLPGVNGIMHWRTCPVKIATCPSGDNPSPAVTPIPVYSWTPSDTTFTAYQSLIGGVGVSQQPDGVVIANIAQLAAFLNDVTGQEYGFYVVGGTIRYSGYAPAVTGNINNGEFTVTFA